MRIEITDTGYLWVGSGLDESELYGLRVYSLYEDSYISLDLAKWNNGIACRVYSPPSVLSIRALYGLFADALFTHATRADFDNMIVTAAYEDCTAKITWQQNGD